MIPCRFPPTASGLQNLYLSAVACRYCGWVVWQTLPRPCAPAPRPATAPAADTVPGPAPPGAPVPAGKAHAPSVRSQHSSSSFGMSLETMLSFFTSAICSGRSGHFAALSTCGN
ncbi:MAG: hypothetical protein F4Y37_15475 [Caldilineaceae bacterium SB0664_bin_22]|nr:hypothetical protein [Caldilineaceae bacterium SB0664_bin_22]